MNFTFPQLAPEVISSKPELQKFLTQSLQFENLVSYCSYRIRLTSIYLYAKCKLCSARISYKIKSDSKQFQLTKMINFHQHLKKINPKQSILQSINKYPSFVPVSVIKSEIMTIHSISNSTFYRYFNLAKNSELDFLSVLILLKERGFYHQYSMSRDFDDLPNYVVVTSPTMIKNFQNYGEFLSFDLTYHLIREVVSENKQFSVGVFCGLNSFLSIVPFAIAICSEETKESFTGLFKDFFEMMGSYPHSIFSDNQTSLRAALIQLKQRNLWNGCHYLDSFHILRNLKRKLRDLKKLAFFVDLIRAENDKQFQKILTTRGRKEEWNKEDYNLLNNFLENAEQYCFSQITPNFVGFGISTGISEKLHDLIKSKIPLSKKYTSVLLKVCQICESISLKKQCIFENRKIEEFLSFPGVEQLRRILCKKVFLKLMRQFSLAAVSLVKTTDVDQFTVLDDDDIGFEVRNHQNLGWQCQCCYSIKTGIPCRHILKIKLLRRQKIKQAIKERWFAYKSEKSAGNLILYPRKTRRL